MVDHGRAAAQALAHLRALGHRRVAFIKGQPFSSDTAVRWQTIRAAARAERIAIDPALVGQLDGNSPLPDLGYAVARGLLRVRPRATALFAFNDISALGAIRAIREAGLRVPEDVSVLGFDDIPSAAYQHPGLTTIRQPLYEMGQRAADTLVARIERPEDRGAADDQPRAVAGRARHDRPRPARDDSGVYLLIRRQLRSRLQISEKDSGVVAVPAIYASAALMNSWHFLTSAIGSSPRYSYSMFTGMSYLFFFTSCSTSLIGVSPSPQGTLSP